MYGVRAGAAYTASKHAVVGFAKNTGYMYAGQGIRCNAIALRWGRNKYLSFYDGNIYLLKSPYYFSSNKAA
ncbi:MAG TPA: SDR family oxidoreductase [Metabacillus sp.]|nr:SDR family oxidoreductase [Metabacillus sp.]